MTRITQAQDFVRRVAGAASVVPDNIETAGGVWRATYTDTSYFDMPDGSQVILTRSHVVSSNRAPPTRA